MLLPQPPRSVERELKGIDPRLRVIPIDWKLDGRGTPFLINGLPIQRPRYNVFIEERGQLVHQFAYEALDGGYLPCDRRLVQRLGNSLTTKYRNDPHAVADALDAHDIKQRQAGERRAKQRVNDFVDENKQKLRDTDLTCTTSKGGEMRDERAFSYPGKTNRSTGRVQMDAKEAGWTTPEGN